MKVLFLDIDGVVNCASTWQRHGVVIGIDPLMAARVAKIQLDTGCEVVLSSSWRSFTELRAAVESQVVKLLDITPVWPTAAGIRGDEVNAWLDVHPEVTRYAIVDDATDFYPDQPVFKTKWETGLTDEIAKQITNYLNRGIESSKRRKSLT